MSELDPKTNEGAWQNVPGHTPPQQPAQPQPPVYGQALPPGYRPGVDGGFSPPQYGQPVYAGQPGYPVAPYPYAPPKKKSYVWAWVLGIFCSLILVCMVGCLMLVRGWGRMLGETQVFAIHDSMKKDDAQTIFALASPMYRTQVGEARSDSMFHTIYSRLGQPVSSNVIENHTGMEGAVKVRYITVQTTFQNGSGTEKFRFYDNTGALTLLGYEISSPALLGAPSVDPSAIPPTTLPTPTPVAPVSRF